MDKFDFYFKVLARYDLYTQLANTKAANHITLLASILASVSALVGWGTSFDKLSCPTVFIIFLYACFLFKCYKWYTSCMEVIKPNRNRNDGNTIHKSNKELSSIFFSDVSKFDNVEEFKQEITSRKDDPHLEDLIEQVYNMAKVTEKKFNDFQKVNIEVIHAVILAVLILMVVFFTKVFI